MAITCEWKDEFGKAKINGIEVTLYSGGNCTFVVCDEHKNLVDFACDINHLKRILGKDGGHWKTDYTEIHLNGWYSEAWKVAKELNKFDIETLMYRRICK